MTVLTCASTGQSITLLGEPKISGEAKVWQTNRNGYLAKIYHDQTPNRVQKLAVMIAHRPKEPNSHLNHISFAWPKSVLKEAQGNCVGFLMPEIKEAKELIDIYNPKRRKDLKLEVDWRFLHTTALNIASIIEAIHISGYVLGDIKPQNILVNDRALPSIIDTDSFQVRNPVNGKVYRCLIVRLENISLALVFHFNWMKKLKYQHLLMSLKNLQQDWEILRLAIKSWK
jgi:DNA-binding helix-hairpin-helix protein with protein kinase domain